VREDDLTVGSFPPWFRRWGIGAWFVVGMALVVVAAVWLLSLTSSIVGPLIAGAVIGAVGGVVVDVLERRGWPRVAGAAVVTLMLAALTLLVVGLVLGAITSQASHLDALLSQALDKVQGWAQSLGITSASDAAKDIKQAAPDIGRTLLKGVASGISGLKSLVVFLGFTIFTSFFLLKDGPSMGRWIERHMGMRPAEARIVTGDILQALRKYFFGLTIVGAFNTAIVTLGALVLGVPLLGTVALVTFLGSYVPIIGAWTAGIVVFALTLADEGTTSAIIMAVIIFAANGPLQQVVQPIVFGATLQLNPLVVFSVTIAAGTLFGMVGLILAAPLVSAAVRVHDHLAALRAPPAGDGTANADRTALAERGPPAADAPSAS
jgi:predicted PurR-regulated permease PerM